jgi:DNA-directed RNA polymerase subunit RPC12/RpoP
MLQGVDRRYMCTSCGLKWFIPASQPERADLAACGGCGGPLVAHEPEPERRGPAAAGGS